MNNQTIGREGADVTDALQRFAPRPGARFYHALQQAPWMAGAEPRRRTVPFALAPAAVALGVLLMAAVLLPATPLQAWAQEVLALFNRADADVVTPQPAPAARPLQPVASPAEAQALLGFRPWAPVQLPAGYGRAELFVQAAAQESVSIYSYSASHLLVLSQRPAGGAMDGELGIGASATVEVVSLGQGQGEYVEGAWLGSEPPAALTWQPAAGVRSLRWQQEGYTFTLTATGAPNAPGALDRAALIAQARALSDRPAASTPAPAITAAAQAGAPRFFHRLDVDVRTLVQPDPATANPYAETTGISLAQAEVLAGYGARVPTFLPDGFHLAEAAYIPDQQALYQIYRLGDDPEKIFVLGQRPAGASLPDLAVGAGAVVQQVEIGGLPGEAVSGSWHTTGNDVPRPGAEVAMQWEAQGAYTQIVWQDGDVVYTLQHGGSPQWQLDLDTLVQVAASLR